MALIEISVIKRLKFPILALAIGFFLKTSFIFADFESYAVRPKILDIKYGLLSSPGNISINQNTFHDGEWDTFLRAQLEAVAQILTLYPQHEIYFLARDAELLYDFAMLMTDNQVIHAQVTPSQYQSTTSRLHLLNISRINIKDPNFPLYLAQEGITEEKLKHRPILFVDTAFSGTIPSKIKRLFPLELQSRIQSHFIASSNADIPSSRVFLATIRSYAVERFPSDMHSLLTKYEQIARYTDRSNRFQQDENGIWHAMSNASHGHSLDGAIEPFDGLVNQKQAFDDMMKVLHYSQLTETREIYQQRCNFWNDLFNELPIELRTGTSISEEKMAQAKLHLFNRLQMTLNGSETIFGQASVQDFMNYVSTNQKSSIPLLPTFEELGIDDFSNKGEIENKLIETHPEWQSIVEEPIGGIKSLIERNDFETIKNLIGEHLGSSDTFFEIFVEAFIQTEIQDPEIERQYDLILSDLTSKCIKNFKLEGSEDYLTFALKSSRSEFLKKTASTYIEERFKKVEGLGSLEDELHPSIRKIIEILQQSHAQHWPSTALQFEKFLHSNSRMLTPPVILEILNLFDLNADDDPRWKNSLDLIKKRLLKWVSLKNKNIIDWSEVPHRHKAATWYAINTPLAKKWTDVRVKRRWENLLFKSLTLSNIDEILSMGHANTDRELPVLNSIRVRLMNAAIQQLKIPYADNLNGMPHLIAEAIYRNWTPVIDLIKINFKLMCEIKNFEGLSDFVSSILDERTYTAKSVELYFDQAVKIFGEELSYFFANSDIQNFLNIFEEVYGQELNPLMPMKIEEMIRARIALADPAFIFHFIQSASELHFGGILPVLEERIRQIVHSGPLKDWLPMVIAIKQHSLLGVEDHLQLAEAKWNDHLSHASLPELNETIQIMNTLPDLFESAGMSVDELKKLKKEVKSLIQQRTEPSDKSAIPNHTKKRQKL